MQPEQGTTAESDGAAGEADLEYNAAVSDLARSSLGILATMHMTGSVAVERLAR
jgi:hypothetical protein